MASHITSDELASLSLFSDWAEYEAAHGGPKSPTPTDSLSLSATTSTSSHAHKVSFCPIAIQISCAADGEKETVVQKPPAGRPRLCVRSYSVEGAALQKSTSKAWGKLVTSFSSSLQPILSPCGGAGGSGVASFSPRSPVDAPSASSSTSSLGLHFGDDQSDDDDPGFIPDPNAGKLVLKFPTLSRRNRGRSLSVGRDSPCRSILKSPTRADSSRSAPIALSETSSISPSSHTLSLSPTALNSPAHLAHLVTVPLQPCCPGCARATDFGTDTNYQELWSRRGRSKRKEDLKALKKAQELADAGDREGAKNEVGIGSAEPDETGEVPLRIGTGRMAHANVDEFGRDSVVKQDEDEKDSLSSSEEEDQPTSVMVAPAPPPADPAVSTSEPRAESTTSSSTAAPSPPPPEKKWVAEPEVYHAPPPKPEPAPASRVKSRRKFSLSAIGNGIMESGLMAAAGSASRGL